MNIVKLSGTLGKDPMVKYSEKGICMLMVDIAENKTVNGEQTVKWHHVRAVGKIAEEMGNQIQKGANVEFKGVYENYKNGSETISYVRATSYTVLGKGKIESENEVLISGFLGQDPRAIQNKNGTHMASMQIAENRTVNNEQVTKWHDIRAVGKIAESIAEKLKKGQLVQFKGVYDNYKNKEGHTVSFVRAIEYKTIEKMKDQEQEVKVVAAEKIEKEMETKPKTTTKRKASATKAKAKSNSFKEKLEKEKMQGQECER